MFLSSIIMPMFGRKMFLSVIFITLFLGGNTSLGVYGEDTLSQNIEITQDNPYHRFPQLTYLRYDQNFIYYSDISKPGYTYKLEIDTSKIFAPEKDFEKYAKNIFSNRSSFQPIYFGSGEYILNSTLKSRTTNIQSRSFSQPLAVNSSAAFEQTFYINAKFRALGENLTFEGYIVGIDDGYIYYVNHADNFSLYKISEIDAINGGSGTKLTNIKNIYYPQFDNGYIYFSNQEDSRRVYRMTISGDNLTKVQFQGGHSTFVVQGNYVYYINTYNNTLYKVKSDGSENTDLGTVISDAIDGGYNYYIYKEFIYYFHIENNMNVPYKISINNTTESYKGEKILEGLQYNGIHFYKDYIYYINVSDNNTLYKANIDGSDLATGGIQVVNEILHYFDSILANGYMYYHNKNFDYKERINLDDLSMKEQVSQAHIILNNAHVGENHMYGYWDKNTKNFRFKLDNSSTNLAQIDALGPPIEVNSSYGLETILINIGATLPENTGYKLAIGLEEYDENYNRIPLKAVPDTYINTNTPLNIATFLEVPEVDRFYFTIELLGDSNDVSKEPIVHFVGMRDGEIPPIEINGFSQYIIQPFAKQTTIIDTGISIGQQQSGSGVYLSAMMNNTSLYKYALQIVASDLKNTSLSYTGTTQLYQTGTGRVLFKNLPASNYAWKSRVISENGGEGEWNEYGNNLSTDTDFSIFDGFEPYKDGYSFKNSSVAKKLLTGGVGDRRVTKNGKQVIEKYKIDGTRWEIFNTAFPESQFDNYQAMLLAFEKHGFMTDDYYTAGNCFGLALSAAVRYSNDSYLRQEFPKFYNQIGIDGTIWENIEEFDKSFFLKKWNEYNESLKTILVFQLYQIGDEYKKAENKFISYSNGKKVLEILNDNPKETYLMTISGIKDNKNFSHAVIPYRVEKDKIYIWDNNYPFVKGSSKAYEQYIEVDLISGAWTANYKRDHFIDISIVNLKDFIISDIGAPLGFNQRDTLITLDGNSDIIITDTLGRRTGYLNGIEVDEIPSVNIITTFNETLSGSIDNNLKKQIYIPENEDVKIAVTGKKNEKYNLTVVGENYVNTMSNIETSSGQIDKFEVLRKEVYIDLDDNKKGNYEIAIDDFKDKGTGSVLIANILVTPEPQKYMVDWNKVETNTLNPIEHQIDMDNDGEYETITTLPAVTQDIQAPASDITLSGSLIKPYIYNNEVNIMLSASDDLSGVKDIYYGFESYTGSFETYENNIKIQQPGEYTLYYYAIDNVENKEDVKEIKFIIKIPKSTATGKISGYVYNDRNGNKVKNRWEPTRRKWKVYIDTNNDGKHQINKEPFVITKRNGYYEFKNLEYGKYILRVFKKGRNYKVRTPKKKYYKVILNKRDNKKRKNFGIRKYKY